MTNLGPKIGQIRNTSTKEKPSTNNQKTKIGVIGTGIFTLRALQSLDPNRSEVKCFERYSRIGGMWNFTGTENLEPDGLERHSNLYYNLRTNNPKFVTETPELSLSIPGDDRCFVDPDTVLNAPDNFADRFEIKEAINFNCWIEHVSFAEEKGKFTIKYRDLKQRYEASESFDYVIVAVGHFRYPNIVRYPGEETFPGKIIHSRDFMDARKFSGKRILVVGASFSGEDLSNQCIKAGSSFFPQMFSVIFNVENGNFK